MYKFEDIKNKLPQCVDVAPYYEELFIRAQQSDIVVEFGIHVGNSTRAILYGLPKVWIGYDPNLYIDLSDDVVQFAKTHNIELQINKKSSHVADFNEADMLFIDSVHVYGFLLKELQLHANKIKKFIGIHDIILNGRKSALNSKYMYDYEITAEDRHKGLMDATEEFLVGNNNWEIDTINTSLPWGCLWLKRKQ